MNSKATRRLTQRWPWVTSLSSGEKTLTAIDFMREIGAALAPDVAPDPEPMREIYARHASRLLP
jgi:hypothetical protein